MLNEGELFEDRVEMDGICAVDLIIIIIIMSLTPVSSSYEDIGGVPSMQSYYSAGMKRCGICMEERSPL